VIVGGLGFLERIDFVHRADAVEFAELQGIFATSRSTSSSKAPAFGTTIARIVAMTYPCSFDFNETELDCAGCLWEIGHADGIRLWCRQDYRI
jgi:hypothetical protein